MMKIKTLKSLSFLVALGLIYHSCSYDIASDLYPTTACVTSDMSFSKDIEPIITTNCNVCHSTAANQGNVMLEGYANTKTYVDNGSLIGSITHASGFSAMPKGASKLSSCNISKIEAWITQGSKNN